MKDKDGKLIPEEIGDLHRCGYWLEKQKMGSFICKKCGREIAYYTKNKQTKVRKYCKDCLKGGAESREVSCIDCGKTFLINNKFDRSTCRCFECQEKNTKKNNDIARAKYRKKIKVEKS